MTALQRAILCLVWIPFSSVLLANELKQTEHTSNAPSTVSSIQTKSIQCPIIISSEAINFIQGNTTTADGVNIVPPKPLTWCQRHPHRCQGIFEKLAKKEQERIAKLKVMCAIHHDPKKCAELHPQPDNVIQTANPSNAFATKVSDSNDKPLEKHLDNYR